jgi:hypothetical protein
MFRGLDRGPAAVAPPIAQERLETTADGRCRYDFRHAWKNGVHAVVLDPLDLLARLCALIPSPRFHMLRDHGVLAAHARIRLGLFSALAEARPEVVPGPEPKSAEPTQIPLSLGGAATELEVTTKHPTRHPWAWLLQRVFAVDIMTCPRCRGAMRLVKIANKPDDIARVLAELASVLVRLRGRGQPQLASSSSTSPRDRPDSEQAVMVEPCLELTEPAKFGGSIARTGIGSTIRHTPSALRRPTNRPRDGWPTCADGGAIFTPPPIPPSELLSASAAPCSGSSSARRSCRRCSCCPDQSGQRPVLSACVSTSAAPRSPATRRTRRRECHAVVSAAAVARTIRLAPQPSN